MQYSLRVHGLAHATCEQEPILTWAPLRARPGSARNYLTWFRARRSRSVRSCAVTAAARVFVMPTQLRAWKGGQDASTEYTMYGYCILRDVLLTLLFLAAATVIATPRSSCATPTLVADRHYLVTLADDVILGCGPCHASPMPATAADLTGNDCSTCPCSDRALCTTSTWACIIKPYYPHTHKGREATRTSSSCVALPPHTQVWRYHRAADLPNVWLVHDLVESHTASAGVEGKPHPSQHP